MSSYDDEKTNLKSIFGDNKYPTGNNFAELINLPDFRLAENNDGTITVNNVTYDMTKSDLGSIAQISEDFNNLPNGLTFVSNGQNNAPESTSAYWVRTFNSSAYSGRKLQVAQADSSNNRYIRTYNGSWNNWDSLATGSELNNKVTDNKNGSITVNGSTFIPADNDTVNAELNNKVHDNHDGTITANGTVFNLLKSLSASSIPQDPTKDYNTLPQGLALMSEINGEPANMPPVKSPYLVLTIAANFATGRKRQMAWLDAGANSTNNNYTYIRYCVGSTWSSWDSIPTSAQISSLIPSTIADTTKLANFTAGLQSGGVSVATSDDLKSVEDLAWCVAHTGDDYMMLYQKSGMQAWIFGALPDATDFHNMGIAFKESSNVLGIPSNYSENDTSDHETWYFYQIGTLNNSFDELKSTYFEVYPKFVASSPNSFFVNYGYLCIKNKILYIGLYGDPSGSNTSFEAGASINAKVPLTSN